MIQSEVQALLDRIDTEYTAACRALYGLSSHSAQHRVISTHMERAENARQSLELCLGYDAAKPLIIEAFDGAIDKAKQSKTSTQGDNDDPTV